MREWNREEGRGARRREGEREEERKRIRGEKLEKMNTNFFNLSWSIRFYFFYMKKILNGRNQANYLFKKNQKYNWFTMLCKFVVYSKVIQTYIYIFFLFHILFHYDFSQDIEYTSLCYTVGPCCLSILYIFCFC